MADSQIAVTPGAGANVDTRTIGSGDHRQVVVLGDEATDAAVVEVINAAPATGDYGLVVRPVGGTPGVPAGGVVSVQGVASGTNMPVAVAAALPAGTNNIGDVDILSVPTLTKGTQGATGFSVQQLHNAGRNPVHYFSNVAVAGASAEALLSLTGMKNFAAVGATTTPAVVTAGKTLRITRFAASQVATATSVYGVFKLRVNTGGVVAVTSPILAVLIVSATTPATANSGNNAQVALVEGIEVPAGSGIGITAQTFNGTTATNGGLVHASVAGYEY